MCPVLHRKLDFSLILRDQLGQVCHLFLRVLAELVHDKALLEITLTKVIFDESYGLLAVVLRQFEHSIFHGMLQVLQGWVRVQVLNLGDRMGQF